MNVMRERRCKCHPPFDIPLFVLVHNSPIHIIITLTINTDMYLNLYYAHPLIYIYMMIHSMLYYGMHSIRRHYTVYVSGTCSLRVKVKVGVRVGVTDMG